MKQRNAFCLWNTNYSVVFWHKPVVAFFFREGFVIATKFASRFFFVCVCVRFRSFLFDCVWLDLEGKQTIDII